MDPFGQVFLLDRVREGHQDLVEGLQGTADPGQSQRHRGVSGDFRGNAFPSISAG